MADIKKCDRCNKVYEYREATIFEELFYSAFSVFRSFMGEKEQRRKNAYQCLSNIYDLCPECEKKLKKWLKKDNDEEAETE